MKILRTLFPALSLSVVLLAGCAPKSVYVAGPPPPPPSSPSPIVEQAERTGFRMGQEDGRRDLEGGFGYHPRRDRRYNATPGYDPGMGPFRVYQDAFRRGYVRGYNQSFGRPDGPR